MDVGGYVVRAHLKEGRRVSELAKAHGVSRSWVYKLLARYRREGDAGLEAHSRRPHRSPSRIADRYEEKIVALRKELVDQGFDAGAETIRFHLVSREGSAPSVPTIWRVLRARGFVNPEPHKRPKSSLRRFCAELPNECWQADVTHVEIDGGQVFEVLNIIDDHSRLCIGSRAFVTIRGTDVVRSLHAAAGTYGFPASFLSDNGAIFTASPRHGVGAVQSELLALGVELKNSRPYHPQTCGKVERFHQTLKKFLASQDPCATKKQLQAQLDRFVRYYNEVRPHRAVGRKPPMEAYRARTKAYPQGPKIDVDGYRVRRDKVDRGGGVTLRYKGVLRHIGVGRAFAGQRILLLTAGARVRVLTTQGELIRTVKIDPTKIYQRMP